MNVYSIKNFCLGIDFIDVVVGFINFTKCIKLSRLSNYYPHFFKK